MPYIISTGTLRNCDLIPRFISAYETFSYTTYPHDIPDRAFYDDHHPYWDSPEAQYLFDDLCEKLEENTPENHWFGSSEGDGACFGFWYCDEE